ncbi:hypothetical protein EVAR_85657_1 [Eumeta japonica]|uniref:Uncharacterized protein n=1 Tax=Eumeta variegata TaxID=151549 RepID=A0A4C1XTR7_EUMVA|nr:hypothetical protein EVAR_85657_1 [Eumeta japonica]
MPAHASASSMPLVLNACADAAARPRSVLQRRGRTDAFLGVTCASACGRQSTSRVSSKRSAAARSKYFRITYRADADASKKVGIARTSLPADAIAVGSSSRVGGSAVGRARRRRRPTSRRCDSTLVSFP